MTVSQRRLLFAVLLAGGVVWGAWHFFRPVPAATGSLPDSVYVWQYRWTPGVVEAVQAAGADASINQLLVVAAEIMPGGGRPQIRPVSPDYALLAQLKKPVALVLRIGPHGGPFEENNPMSRAIADAARQVLADAADAGLAVAELQLDFDCPTRCLADYAQWISQVKAIAAPTPVSFTALPAWLDAAGFRRLINTADGYVLQVHSVEKPGPDGTLAPLCDVTKTRRWIRRAARLGKPFRVALPTYTYRVGFDDTGRYVGVAAEARETTPLRATRWKFMSPDATALAALVRTWRESHPAALTGIVWYRLPVPDDTLNWTTSAWNKVRRGEIPSSQLHIDTRQDSGLLRDIVIQNTGDLAMPLPERVTLQWRETTPTAADAIGGYRIQQRSRDTLVFQRSDPAPTLLLPGKTHAPGWVRFSTEPTAFAGACE